MASLHIHLGNKNHSSWSLRGYLALHHTGAEFDETVIPLDQPGTKKRLLEISPSGRVPCLHHGSIRIWESLAIGEYLAELFPAAKLWPADQEARARARSISHEMHAGFAALRENLPMDLRAHGKAPKRMNAEVERDIARIRDLWRTTRAHHGKGGSFLFGHFTLADAMFAPVVSRFRTYGVDVDQDERAYMDAIWELPGMRAWRIAAEKEPWSITG
jgi:glutathione S-transferase